jgi:hypothetical protein
MQFESVRAAVSAYLQRGFRPMPMVSVGETGDCRCGGYVPSGNKWVACRAGKHATHEVESAWKNGHRFTVGEFSEADNVALALGPWKESLWLVCLDVDGTDSLAPFFPPMPRTLAQKSPRGMHYFFTVPSRTPLGNWVDAFKTKDRGGFALDVRYARGRVNVAPSRTAFGGYEWRDWKLYPQPLPEFALHAILAERRSRNLPVADLWERGGKDP